MKLEKRMFNFLFFKQKIFTGRKVRKKRFLFDLKFTI
jgi:hypothetical protein